MVHAGRSLAIAVSLVMSACSFAGVERLSSGYRSGELPACSQTLLPVGADALMAALSAASAVLFATDTDADEARLGYFYAGIGATFAGSALYGWREHGRCARARAEHRRWLARMGPAQASAPAAGGQR